MVKDGLDFVLVLALRMTGHRLIVKKSAQLYARVGMISSGSSLLVNSGLVLWWWSAATNSYFFVLTLYSANPIAATTIAMAITTIMIVTVPVDVSWKLRSTCKNAVSPKES